LALKGLKKSELIELITQQKPEIIAICESPQPKHGEERTFQDYAIDNSYVLNYRS